ncbi:DUF4469 domain-containing protein [Treponema zioleckii]|uniref:DUF4469 domain-containing protein n=1 Tax=Treponema zioleckii TaxID=331680 RepID=UPI002412F1AE|nr:DUF4469 domain-containing protein [Treponema zioleckii]
MLRRFFCVRLFFKHAVEDAHNFLLFGERWGIYFAPVDSEGKMTSDETSWVKVEESSLFRNKPSELNFFVPDSLSEGSWKIVLRTSYLGKSSSRKTMLESNIFVSRIVAFNSNLIYPLIYVIR